MMLARLALPHLSPYPVHRPLHLQRSSLESGEGGGHGRVRVVVSVNAQGNVASFRHCARGLSDLPRQRAAVGVAKDQAFCACIGRGPQYLQRVVRFFLVSVEEVFRVKKYASAYPDKVPDGVGNHGQVFFQRALQHRPYL